MFILVNVPLIPLRASADERSEMVSQLLFGQQIEILESTNNWWFVRNLIDDYTGWIGNKTLPLKNATEKPIDTSHFTPTKTVLMTCFKTSSVEKILLPAGSMLPKINKEQFQLYNEIYQIATSDFSTAVQNNAMMVIEYAIQFINAPYLWGGKSVMGIDCSGLVQIVFSMLSVFLPRDASMQVEHGEVVDFLSEARPADLAFFENEEGKIIHVGILVNSHQIIHASGCVKKEIIDSQGIISSQTGEYSHRLRVIKRLL